MTEEKVWFYDQEFEDILEKYENDEHLTLPEIKLSLRFLNKLPINFSCYVLQNYLLGLIDRLEDE
jgi:hypothetical protein